MSNQELESKQINGFIFFKPKFKKEWVISGVDICKHLGYKNPYKQSHKIFDKYKEYFTKSSHLLRLPRTSKTHKNASQTGVPLLDQNYQEIRCYTRPGCWFFVSKCNIDKANSMIEKLFNSFDDLLKVLESKNTLEWKQSREQGKIGRRKMTDAVKQFIEYAKDQGSKNADRYYGNITKTTYCAMGFKGKVPKNFRDDRSQYELAVLNLLEIATDDELFALMDREIPYKEIFQEVKLILNKRSMAIINCEIKNPRS